MKKVYITPEVEVLELDIETLMVSMSVPDGPGYGGEGSGMEAEANDRRRGEWGNLWAHRNQ